MNLDLYASLFEMNHFPKKKRAVYEREFTFKHVLQNLQGYRLATGDVDPQLLSETRLRHGDDPGRVYGALMVGVGNSAPAPSRHMQTGEGNRRDPLSVASGSGRKRRRRRKSRKKVSTLSSLPDTSGEASTGNSQTDNVTLDRPVKRKPELAQNSASSSLVAAYTSSSSCSDNDSTSRPSQGSKGQLPIPSAIQDMFKERVIPPKSEKNLEESTPRKTSFWNTACDDNTLGYFEGDDESLSPSTDDEASGSRTEDQSDLMSGRGHRERIDQLAQGVLTSYTCWKCSNVGHLPKDCTVAVPRARAVGGAGAVGEKVKIPKALQSLYAACREIRAKKGQRCADCGVCNNLACCLDCRSVLCDGRGHLASHLLDHSTHNTLYSFKLQRLLKCCKSTCEVVSVYDLLVCSHCLGKAFSQHYSMINAIWSTAGLRKIPNAICCEEHFQWHRMNCPNSCEEALISKQKLLSHNNSSGLLSEFCF